MIRTCAKFHKPEKKSVLLAAPKLYLNLGLARKALGLSVMGLKMVVSDQSNCF